MGSTRSATKWAVLSVVVAAAAAAPSARALDPTLPQPGRRPPAAPVGGSAPAGPGPATPNVPDVPPPVPVTDRQPIPDAAAQQQATKLVEQVYREPIAAARSPEQKKALGQQFLRKGIETTTDPAGKYVLLTRARDVAADAGDVDTCLAAILGTEQSFAVEPGSADLETISRLAKNVRGVEPHRTLARYLMGSANESVTADKYEAAKRLADMAQSAAARANDPALLRTTAARAKEVREVEAAYAAAKPALAAVSKGATDADSSLAAGRFKCFFKGEWAGGSLLLATGSDATLKDLAGKELGGLGDADQQSAVADGWWAEAEKVQGVARNLLMAHARTLYQQAEPSLGGLPKDKAAKRVKETEGLAALYATRAGWVHPPQQDGGGSAKAGSPVAATPVGIPTPGAGAKPAATGKAGGPLQLPPQFTREWKSPILWVNKPEQVTIVDNKVTILNEGGTNSVCKDAPLTPQKDGSMTLQWDYGEKKSGYEVWKMDGKDLVIERWNSKAEKDGGQPARRVGAISGG